MGDVTLAHSLRLRAIVSGRAKTDKLDAALLAKSLLGELTPPSYVPGDMFVRAAASLFDCVQLLRSAIAGAINVYHGPFIRNIERFNYRVNIHDPHCINFADAPDRLNLTASVTFRTTASGANSQTCLRSEKPKWHRP